MSPLPSTKVIHDRWSTHHQPVAVGAMTATCQIAGAGGSIGFDPASGQTTTGAPTAAYDGPCRVQADFRPTPVVTADQATADRRYLVALPAGTVGVAERMTVTITAAPHNAGLVGRALTVQAIERNSETFEVDLICVEAEFQAGT